MKTFLKFLSVFFAASVPSALAAESVGAHLGFDALDALTAFAVTLIAMIVLADYSRRGHSAVRIAKAIASPAACGTPAKADHALAA
jgi:hypothetical protein